MMINITGHVYFDKQRTNSAQGLQGIHDMSVVLQSMNEPYMRLAVLTNPQGEYAFHNVP